MLPIPIRPIVTHSVPKWPQKGGPVIHRRDILFPLHFFFRIEPGIQQYEQAASRLQTMLGEFVRSSVEGPRRGLGIEVHADAERDRVQRRREMKRRKPRTSVDSTKSQRSESVPPTSMMEFV